MSGFATRCDTIISSPFRALFTMCRAVLPPLASSHRHLPILLSLARAMQLSPHSSVIPNLQIQASAVRPSLRPKAQSLEGANKILQHLLGFLGSPPLNNKISNQLRRGYLDNRLHLRNSSHKQTHSVRRYLVTLPTTKPRNSRGRVYLGVRIINSNNSNNPISQRSAVGDLIRAARTHCNRNRQFPLAAMRGAQQGHHFPNKNHKRTLSLDLVSVMYVP